LSNAYCQRCAGATHWHQKHGSGKHDKQKGGPVAKGHSPAVAADVSGMMRLWRQWTVRQSNDFFLMAYWDTTNGVGKLLDWLLLDASLQHFAKTRQ
jgi:hypothetical protein